MCKQSARVVLFNQNQPSCRAQHYVLLRLSKLDSCANLNFIRKTCLAKSLRLRRIRYLYFNSLDINYASKLRPQLPDIFLSWGMTELISFTLGQKPVSFALSSQPFCGCKTCQTDGLPWTFSNWKPLWHQAQNLLVKEFCHFLSPSHWFSNILSINIDESEPSFRDGNHGLWIHEPPSRYKEYQSNFRKNTSLRFPWLLSSPSLGQGKGVVCLKTRFSSLLDGHGELGLGFLKTYLPEAPE